MHQPDQELPNPAARSVQFDRDREAVDLRLLARPVDQRDIDLGPLPAPLAQVVAQRCHTDGVALLAQLPMQPRRRQPLLRRGPLRPLAQQRIQPRLDRIEDRSASRDPLAAYRFRRFQVAPYRVAADPQLARHLPPAPALDQDLMPQHVYILHP